MSFSAAKANHLQSLSTSTGIIGALAIDQRRSLRKMIADAAAVSPDWIPDSQLEEFKTVVTRELTPYASAVLLDAEYGLTAAQGRAAGCGLLLAYEADGYENPRPHKMLALMPRFSVQRLADLGADGIKILLTYSPFDNEEANQEKKALVERIGAECEGVGLPFFLEPVGYDPEGLDVKSFEYAQRKPEIVIRSMEEFSQPRYRVDVLKVEFPVNAAYVEGSPVYGGTRAYTHAEALDHYRAADHVAQCPYIYLSAGVRSEQFAASLNLAAEAGARFSGVLCGRATWQDGVPAYTRDGVAGLETWLQSGGRETIGKVNECLRAAVPWQAWHQAAVAL